MPELDDERTTVSVEAHERVKQERDEAKARADVLEGVATDVAKLNQAYDYFKAKEGVTDPYGLAQAAIQNITVRDADGEDLPGRLDGWYDERAKMFGGPPAVNDPAGNEPETDDAPAVTAPRPNVAGPNPAAPGEPVTVGGRLKPGDEEYQEVLKREGLAGLRKLEQQGRIERHPDNPYRTAQT